jgi:hypothetical protein
MGGKRERKTDSPFGDVLCEVGIYTDLQQTYLLAHQPSSQHIYIYRLPQHSSACYLLLIERVGLPLPIFLCNTLQKNWVRGGTQITAAERRDFHNITFETWKEAGWQASWIDLMMPGQVNSCARQEAARFR